MIDQHTRTSDCGSWVADDWRLINNADEAVGMKSATKAGRNRVVVYWISTALLALELAVGGLWDVLRVPQVREVTDRLGYPAYFLVILGVWKLLGSIAVMVPRFARLKEWTYAGVVFNLTGALASHIASRVIDAGTLTYLLVMMGVTAASWVSRPPSRRNFPADETTI